jgi:hypothetical protein
VSFRTRFWREIAALGLPAGAEPSRPVTEGELTALPEPARRYMRFTGVPGRPRDWRALPHGVGPSPPRDKAGTTSSQVAPPLAGD